MRRVERGDEVEKNFCQACKGIRDFFLRAAYARAVEHEDRVPQGEGFDEGWVLGVHCVPEVHVQEESDAGGETEAAVGVFGIFDGDGEVCRWGCTQIL